MIEPLIPIFSSGRFLPPGCEIKFLIYWNTTDMVLMSDATDTTLGNREPKFHLVPYTAKLHIKQVHVQDDVHVAMEKEQLVNQRIAIFPHFETRTVTHTVVNGRREANIYNIYNGKIPNYMMVMFVRGQAMTGHYQQALTNFEDVNQSSIRVTRDGEELPYERLDLQKGHYREIGYNTLLRFSGQGIGSAPIGISRESYVGGNYLLQYNFNPDGEQNYNYDYERNTGNVNLGVEFSQATENNITIIVIGYFEQQGWLDGNKVFTLRYTY